MRAPGRTASRRTSGAAPDVALLVQWLRESYGGGAWHGPAVRTALRGVDARLALWRPAPGRHNLWELVLHLAYARHRILIRIADPPHPPFPRALAAAWWPKLPEEQTEAAWRADLALLQTLQRRLLDVLPRVPAARLASPRPGQRRTRAHEVLGVAMHDAYHAGQVQLIRRLSERG